MTDLTAAIDGYLALPARRARAGPGDAAGVRLGPGGVRAGAGRGRAGRARPDAATRYLARARRGRRPAWPTSLRRRTAAIRGFYRFAYGDGLIATDLAARIDLPKQAAAPAGDARRRTRPSACSRRPAARPGRADPDPRPGPAELLYAAGLRISEALGLDREDLSLDGGFVRVIGKGDRERLVPVGEVALDWLRRYLDDVRPAWLALQHVAPLRGGPLFLSAHGRRLGRQQAWAIVRGGGRRRPAGPRHAAHPSPLVRDPSARGRSRPAGRPGVARSCEYQHHPAVHPSDRRTDPRRVRPCPPAGLKESSHR